LHTDHGAWYRKFFSPNVDAGFLKPSDLAGYRADKVFIRNASHVPPSQEAVRDMMPELCDLLEAEPSAAVRAVLGHFLFVYIHPYFDGNGRLGRFLMNIMLASGGYPWTIIQIKQRAKYMAALEAASSLGKIELFARFVAESMVADIRKEG
jgi:Fic family protein